MFTAGIIYFVAASIFAHGHCLECMPFTCINETRVLIMNVPFNCPKGLVCNWDSDLTSCAPCIKKPEPCPFKCKGNTVDYNGYEVDCDDPFVCNQTPRSDCKACIRPKCNKDLMQFECDESNPPQVIIGKYKLPCNDGYKCNSEFLQPCEPCISKDENLRQPFIQPTNFSLIQIDAVSRAIDVPDEDMIDCNDGKSFLQPCRPGPTGANYYFKCTLTWNLRYSTSIKPCTSMYSDKLCRKIQGLCLPSD